MTYGFIDTFLFCPPEASSAAEMEGYIIRLLEWRAFAATEAVALFVSANASAMLAAETGFPPWHGITAAIERLGISGVQTPDIFVILRRFLERTATLEDELGIREVLLEEANFQPADYKLRSPALADDFLRSVALMCVLAGKHPNGESELVLYSRGFSRCPDNGMFSAKLVDCEGEGCPKLPDVLLGKFPLFSCGRNARRALKSEAVWGSATTLPAYSLAIELEIERMAESVGHAHRRRWRLGPELIASVISLNFKTADRARRLMRAFAETALDQNMRATHPIRTGEGGNDPQVTDGDAAGWRRDIDPEYHLHYWSSPAGFEFASVVVHNDLSIPRPEN